MFNSIDARLVGFVGLKEKAPRIISRFSGLQAVTGRSGLSKSSVEPVSSNR